MIIAGHIALRSGVYINISDGTGIQNTKYGYSAELRILHLYVSQWHMDLPSKPKLEVARKKMIK